MVVDLAWEAVGSGVVCTMLLFFSIVAFTMGFSWLGLLGYRRVAEQCGQ